MVDETPASRESLDRLAAFTGDGRAEYGHAVLSAVQRDWPRLPLELERLRGTGRTWSTLEDVLLGLLEDRFQLAKDMASGALERAPQSLPWAMVQLSSRALLNQDTNLPAQFGSASAAQAATFLRGTPELRRDPRDCLAILLALESPDWAAYGFAQARQWHEQAPEELWPALLLAQALTAGHLDVEAQALLEEVVACYPDCAAAWSNLIDTIARQHPTDPLHSDLLSARSRGRLACGAPPSRRAHSSIGLASAEVAAGRPGQAVSILERSLQAATGAEGAAVRLMLADLQAGQGRYRRAIEALEPAILDAGQRGLHPWLDRYLNWVVAAAGDSVPQSERITDKQTAARFDAVVHRYPNDPLALLRRLEFRQRSENQSRLLAEEEARTALELLANRIGKVSMDDLRPGAKRLWGAHLLSVSPLLAEEFARGQLDLQVGDIDAWSLLSRRVQRAGTHRRNARPGGRSTQDHRRCRNELPVCHPARVGGCPQRARAAPLAAGRRRPRHRRPLRPQQLHPSPDGIDGRRWRPR
ncbi:MAG: tetratricopeptide repeat protein [Planctomycetota bacterium]